MGLYYDRAEIQIDLDALIHNLTEMKRNIPDDSLILAVVKTDAYGHGAVPIADCLETIPWIWGFGVATVEEGVSLRREGIQKPILILGATFPKEIGKSVAYGLTNNVFTYETARMLSEEAVRRHKTVNIHISVDTGMTRLGFGYGSDDIDTVEAISRLPGLRLEGMFTHFARSDEFDPSATLLQIEKYESFRKQLEERGIICSCHHMANSSGIINLPESSFDVVRAGISMYGMYSGEEVYRDRVKLRPVLSLKSKVIFVKEVPAGIPVSYGGTYITQRMTRIATIPIGYGDGYPRTLSGKGHVLIHGKKAPILGRVCMDQFMVDVTEIPETETGDVATVIGTDGNESITVDDITALSGRFHYEVVCDLNKRIPRTYYRDGGIVQRLDYFVH